MKTLLYFGFASHKKTGSVEFVIDLLRTEYDVKVCWIDLFQPKPYASLDRLAGHYDVVASLQALPPRAVLNMFFTWRHAVLFPMYDGCPSIKKIEKWYPYRDFQIICFSRTLCEQLTTAGFCARYVQYFPKPVQTPDWGAADSAFLWARREEINCNLAAHLLSDGGLKRMHIHKCPDPGTRFIAPAESGAIEFSFSEWFAHKNDMQEKIAQSAYYFAPRQREGIGHSFLEAMAMGRCVIAHDESTMNEYIEHGKTGFLYRLGQPCPLPAHDLRAIQRQTRDYIETGYHKWMQEQYRILEWLTEPVETAPKKILLRMTHRFLKNPVKVMRALPTGRSSEYKQGPGLTNRSIS